MVLLLIIVIAGAVLLYWSEKSEKSAKASTTHDLGSGQPTSSAPPSVGGPVGLPTSRPTVTRSHGSKFFDYGGSGGESIKSLPLAVIDVETTGLDAKRERIVEIAICRVEGGEIVDEWSSVVNPNRGPGPTHIHGITRQDLEQSPEFHEVMGEVLERLDGAVIVAHNASFEERFLEAEFRRQAISVSSINAACTLRAARQTLKLANYKLATLCSTLGVDLTNSHTALGDARATAEVARKLITLGYDNRWEDLPPGFDLPAVTARPYTRVAGLRKGTDGWMSSITASLPRHDAAVPSEIADTYVDLVMELLDNGSITAPKAKEIAAFVGISGLGARQVESLNERVLAEMSQPLSPEGRGAELDIKFLERCSIALGSPREQPEMSSDPVVAPGSRIWLHPELAESLREGVGDAGFVVAKNLTRTVVCAVIPDNCRPSVQTKRAKELGMPLITTSELARIMGSKAE